MLELGGFAENPEVIEGTEEEWEAFNICLAIDYFNAIVNEDFEEIGEDGPDFYEVAEWLKYYKEFSEEDIKQIKIGEIKTYKNRTFIEAIIKEKQVGLAKNYLFSMNVTNLDLLAFYILNCEGINDSVINDYDPINGALICSDKEEYKELVSKLFERIENYIEKIDDVRYKTFYKIRFKEFIYNIKFSKSYGKLTINDVDKSGYVKKLLKKN